MDGFLGLSANNWWIIIGTTIIAYVIAYLFSKKTECVVLYKWYDFAALITIALTPVVFFILLLCFEDKDKGLSIAFIVGQILLGLSLLTMLITSVVSNLGHGWVSLLYVTVSIISKIPFILGSFLIAFALFLVFNSGDDRQKDSRYRDGTRGNKKTRGRLRALALFFAVFTPLLFNLIKPEEFKDRIKDRIRRKVDDSLYN